MLEKGNFRISISMDSFLKETYEKIRPNARFDDVMQNVAFFSAHARKNNYLFNISVCPMQQNWSELPEILLKAIEMKACVYFNTVLLPEYCSLKSLDYLQLQNIINELSGLKFPVKTKIEKKNNIHFRDFLNQLKDWQHEKEIIFKQKEEQRLLWIQCKAEMEKKSIKELCEMIMNKIEQSMQALSGIERKKKRLDICNLKLFDAVNLFQNHPCLKNVLFNLMQGPADKLFEEIEKHEVEFLRGRVRVKLAEIEKETVN